MEFWQAMVLATVFGWLGYMAGTLSAALYCCSRENRRLRDELEDARADAAAAASTDYGHELGGLGGGSWESDTN